MKNRLLLILILTLFLGNIAFAQTKYGNELLVNTTTTLNQRNPDIAVDKQGNYVIVWEDQLNEENYGIYGQRYSTNGNKIGTEFQINTYTTLDQKNASVSMDSLGNFVVVWQSADQDGSGPGIYGQRFNSSGSKSGTEFIVNDTTLYQQINPDVAMDDLGNFVVVWESNHATTGLDSFPYRAYGQRFNSTGSKNGIQFSVDASAVSYDVFHPIVPKVDLANDGSFVAVWTSWSTNGLAGDIYGQRFDTNGNKAGGQFPVNTTTNASQRYPDIALDKSKNFWVVWQSYQLGPQDVFGQRFNSTGTKVGSEFKINTYDNSNDQEFPSISSGGDDVFVATWQSADQDDSSRAVVAQRYHSDGTTFGPEFQANTYWYDDQISPAVAVDKNGDFAIVWQSNLQDGSGNGVYAQLFKMAPVFTAIPQININEDNNYKVHKSYYYSYVSDETHADAELTWQFGNGTNITTQFVNDSLTITPSSNWFGIDSFIVIAKDPTNLSDTTYQVVNVAETNDAPVVADIPNQTVAEGASFTTISLDDYVSDVDNLDSEMTWTYSGNTDLSVTITSRVATIGIPADWNGAETITFTATDPDNLFDSDAATFTVTAVNDAPVVADIPNQTIAEGASFTTISLDDYVSDVDNLDSEMTWSYSGNTNLSVTITSRVATIGIPADWNGAETITFTATDPGNLFDSDAATFTVTAVNDAPVVTDIPNQTIAEGASFATISLDDYVSDVDNLDSELTWSTSGETDLTVTIDVNRIATITIPVDWNGAETITFTATDPGNLFDSDAATFTVTAVNDAPVVTDIPN
ncbi:MAG: Ig-like domain-containing protein, partial [Calditrichaceae bacterium]